MLPYSGPEKSWKLLSFKIVPCLSFQVTCYSHKDDNNKWLIKKAYEDYGEYWIMTLKQLVICRQ